MVKMERVLARYFEDADDEVGVTLSRLRRFSRERQWKYIEHWFLRMFEDPSNETPRAEGEFQFVWGGPYDALEELETEFQGIEFERLEDFARRLEGDHGIYDWAPGREHPDHLRAAEEYEREYENEELEALPSLEALLAELEAGVQTRFGDQDEQLQRAVVLSRLNDLDAKLDQLLQASASPGMGHNMPPESLVPAINVNITVVVEARDEVAGIREELQKPEPDAAQVAKKSSYLKELLGKLGIAIPVTVTGAALSLVVKALGTQHPELANAAAAYVTQTVIWLSHVIISPF